MSERENERVIPLGQHIRTEPYNTGYVSTPVPLPSLLSSTESFESDSVDFLDMESVPTTKVANTTTTTAVPLQELQQQRQQQQQFIQTKDETKTTSPQLAQSSEDALDKIADGDADDIPQWTPFIPDDFGSTNSQISDVSDQLLSSVLSDDARDNINDESEDKALLEPSTDSHNDNSYLQTQTTFSPNSLQSLSSPLNPQTNSSHQGLFGSESAPIHTPTRYPNNYEDIGAKDDPLTPIECVQTCTPPYAIFSPTMYQICSCLVIVVLILAVVGLSINLVRTNNENAAFQAAADAASQNPSGIMKPPTSYPTLDPTTSPSLAPSISPSLRPTQKPSLRPSPAPTPLDIYQKAKLLRSFLIDHNYSSENSLDNVDSPQSQALFFMINDELVDLPVPVTRVSSFARSTTVQEEARIAWLERYVASVFYFAMSGDLWSYSLNLVNHSLPTCSWNQTFAFPGGQVTSLGILCNPNSRIESIQVVRNNLMGSLPKELGLLTDLTSLNLEQNSVIVGTIPSTFAKLNALREFSCPYCSLSGTIPSWIGTGWPKLTVLGLTQNTFFGSFPPVLSELTNLAVLGLDDNLMTGELNVLNSMPMLEQVYLENNVFKGNIDQAFLESASGLAALDISGNQLTGSVPIHLMGLKTFRIMDLHNNKLSVFDDSIPQNSSLTFLALHGNPFNGTVPSTLSNLRALSHLDMTSTLFTGSMPELVGNEQLRYLFLADTNFERGSIPNTFQNLTNLIDLSLMSSSRTGTIPSWIVGLNQLVLLDLHLNELTGPIPRAVADMESLEFLLLNRNDLTGEIPTDFRSADLLQIVFVEGNSLNGTMDPLCSSATSLLAAVADCGSDLPEVECRCCNLCCDDGNEDCHDKDSLSQYDPQWEDGFKRRYYDFDQDLGIT